MRWLGGTITRDNLTGRKCYKPAVRGSGVGPLKILHSDKQQGTRQPRPASPVKEVSHRFHNRTSRMGTDSLAIARIQQSGSGPLTGDNLTREGSNLRSVGGAICKGESRCHED